MVVPAELAQTTYGITTLGALCANFSRIRLITFRHNWFEDVQQETFLLLAERRGGSCTSAELIPMERISDLGDSLLTRLPNDSFQFSPDVESTVGLAFIDPPARDLWSELTQHPSNVMLRDLGDVAVCMASACRTPGLQSDWPSPYSRPIRCLPWSWQDAATVAAC